MSKSPLTMRFDIPVNAFLKAEAERMNTSAAVIANEIVKNHMNNHAVIQNEMEKVKEELKEEMKRSEDRMRLIIVQFLKDFTNLVRPNQ